MALRLWRKRWLLVVLAALFATAAFVWLSLQSRRPPFTAETAERIRVGMTRAEVVSILRVPPGDYMTSQVQWGPGGMSRCSLDYWRDEHGWIAVWFDETGKVAEVRFENPMFVYSEAEPFWKRLLPPW